MRDENCLRIAGGKQITDCLGKLQHFIKHDAYYAYDVVGYQFEHETDRLRLELRDAMNKAMLARSKREAWQPFLDIPLDELAAVPTQVDLIDSSNEEYIAAREALRSVYERLTNATWITDMAASKMLYLKRPKLVAISDSYTRAALGVKDPSWRGYSSRGTYYAARGMAVLDAARAVGQTNKGFLTELQRQLDPLRVEKVRIIDILVWADMAIPTHPKWSKQACENGWTSIA